MKTLKWKTCPVCHSSYQLIYTMEVGDIVICSNKNCRLVFREKQPSDDQLAELYNNLYYPEELSEAQKQNSDETKFYQHLQFLDKIIPLRNKSVLDYGSGIGNFLNVCRRFNPNEVLGVELNSRARAIANQRGFKVVANILELKDKKFDIIYMNDVIEHLRNPLQELLTLSMYLKEGGYIFVVTMNLWSLKHWFLRERWELITDPTHFYFFHRKSLTNLLKQTGVFEDPMDCRIWVKFSHHNLFRSALQFVLVKLGLDSGIRFLVRKNSGVTK